MGLAVLGVGKLDFFKLLNLSIQIIINWRQTIVEDLKVVADKLVGKGQDIAKVPGLVFQKHLRMKRMSPSVGEIVFVGDTHGIVLDLKTVVNFIELLFGCFESVASESVVFGCVTWVLFGLFFKQFLLFF